MTELEERERDKRSARALGARLAANKAGYSTIDEFLSFVRWLFKEPLMMTDEDIFWDLFWRNMAWQAEVAA